MDSIKIQRLYVVCQSNSFEFYKETICLFCLSDSHELRYVVGCFYNGTVEVIYEIDGDLALYADFQNNVIVSTVPPYVQFDIGPYPNIFSNTLKAKRAYPPESILYPADEVLRGVENHLICFVNRFYPPRVKVTWTKNNRPVSAGVSTSSYMPNNDQTFHCFSTLTITPEHGDVYSCTVEHAALETPTTRIWDVDLKSHQDLALDLYCGGGLTVAFVGVAIGTFLIVKGRYGH
uniref:Ig-like domain-containing protein n=1 Tax=Neogobius melanostomus TaxID=47308 RepID=A0A8C6V7Y6_9GOBI